tara:strand:- start:243 stop:497 length:255 start_codon:yes stop_codon:yes gene_type:complete
MGQVIEDFEKVKVFVDRCVASLEKGDYAYICDGYQGGSDGGKYDNTIQSYSSKIVNKLLSLGYIYTTNHGFGCKDWKFYKEIDL